MTQPAGRRAGRVMLVLAWGAGLLLACPKQSVAQVLPLKVRAALSDCDAGVMRAV